MQYINGNTTFSSVYGTSSASSNPVSPISPAVATPVILSPCAACKFLRRRCAADKCVLAPYFPPTEPIKFAIAHKIFGASNIIKLLQEIPESKRADAVTNMVYEANARIRDPVYGCAGAICLLQKQISELQAEVAKAQAEILNMQCQNANLLDLICKQMATTQISDQEHLPQEVPSFDHLDDDNSNFLLDESILGGSWGPLWT